MVLFFASPIGLGHATRDLAIAEQLKTDLLFVSGEAAAKLLAKSYNTLDVYRPEKFIVESGQLQHSFKWLINYYSYYKKCKKVAKGLLHKHDGLIISDEDFASIGVGEEMGRKRILVTDITETHFTSGPASLIEKMMNKEMQKMMKACDCVVIPDVGDDSGNVRYVGPIVRHASAGRDVLRRRFRFTKNMLVASIGGTDAGKYLIEKTIEAHRKLQSRLDSELVIVSGPSLKLPDSPDYHNLGFVDNLHELVCAADLVISLAGRSTMDESIAYGTPGIFIPIKGHFEQEVGAARLGYKYEDIFRLEALIEEKIGRRNNEADASGAERAAKIISTLNE
ncbi:MAG TPA: glycosyltransferase [Nitrososphaera sp.]|jgi:UDP-N-acetylglucosamine--N-acetylmuramyl-(pentapeptide) pyrophosphoryl-undecaprenol N-acetylglucosamine transferase